MDPNFFKILNQQYINTEKLIFLDTKLHQTQAAKGFQPKPVCSMVFYIKKFLLTTLFFEKNKGENNFFHT